MKRLFTTIFFVVGFSLAAKADGLSDTRFNWTGFYVGAHVGAGQLVSDWNFPFPCTPCSFFGGRNFDSRLLGGGQVGFNYQTGSWVWGIEGQFSWTTLHANNIDLFFADDRNHTKTDFAATLAARIGYAYDRWLAFGKAGGALAHNKYSETDVTGFFCTCVLDTASENRLGWMVGGGLEYAFARNWSMKLEYDYMNFGNHRVTLNPTPAAAAMGFGSFDEDISQRISIIKVGINYRFGDRRDELPLK
jgi:outer membrane immunogenic protein